MGSLSDYKICGNSGCETKDYRLNECEYTAFPIDKQFGYFPKDAVKEEQVYATIEKVVETQRSDFFCMDELGYPIDSSDLDSEDENGDQKIQIQESESTPTVPHTDDTNTESPSPSADPSADFPVPPQQADATTTAGDENKNAGDAAAGTQGGRKEAPDNLAAPSEQGGSPSSSWLGSSVTGWLGLGREEESVDVAEEAKDNDSKETKSETFTSSLTGWLGFGGEGIPDDTVESGEDDKESADSLTSTMTGWLGFSGETKTDSAKTEQDGKRETGDENEPEVTFRSRRMSLDLEGSQLHEEEEKEVRTLDWLGSGLSRTLGFGATTQESGHGAGADREAEETVEEEKEQSSSSWFGIGNILGFGKDESEVDESTGGRSKDEDTTFERETLLENGDASQTQTEEEKIEPDTTRLEEKRETEINPEVGDSSVNSSSNKDKELDVDEQGQVPQSEIEAESDTSALEENSSDMTEDSGGSKNDAASTVEQKDIFPQTALGEKPFTIDEERSAETEGEEHQVPKTIEKDINREPRGEEIRTDQDFLTQPGISVELSPEDLPSDSTVQSVGEAEGDERGTEITPVETGAGGDGQDSDGSDDETDALRREMSATQTDESAERSQGNAGESSGKSQPLPSSGTGEERHEPVHSEDGSVSDHGVKPVAENSETPATIVDNNVETETHHELGGEGGVWLGLFNSTERRSEESLFEKASEEEMGTISPGESTTLMENNGDQVSASPQAERTVAKGEVDVEKLKETEENLQNDLHHAQTEKETLNFEKGVLSESRLKEADESEKETETGEVDGEEEKQEEKLNVTQDELKEEGGLQQGKEEEKLDEAEVLKEKEEQQGVKEIQEEGKQEAVEELEKERRREELMEVEEIKEEEQQNDMEEKKEEDKQNEVLESNEEEEKQEKEEELNGETTQGGMNELKGNEEQWEVKETQGEGKQEDVEELNNVEETKEEEKQGEVGEMREKEKPEESEEEEKQEADETKGVEELQVEVEELKEAEEEKQEEAVELMGEKQQAVVGQLKEGEKREEAEEVEGERKQEDVDELLGGEKREETKEVNEEKKPEEVEESKEEEKQEIEEFKEEVEELKGETEQEEVEALTVKEKQQEEVEEVKEEEKQKEIEEIKEKEKQEVVVELNVEEEERERVEELQGEKKQEEVEALTVKEKQQEEVEEVKEEEKQKEIEEIKEKEKQEVVVELNVEEEERERVEELQGEKKQEEVEELKEEENIEEVDEAEEKKQEEVEELEEEEKREAVDEAEEKKPEEVEELKEEENIEEVDEAEEKKQVEESKVEEKQEIEKFKEEEKQEKVEELQGEKKPVEVEEELIEKEKQQEVKEMQEAVKEEEKQKEIGEIKVTQTQGEFVELKIEEEEQVEVEDLQGEKKQEEVEEEKREEVDEAQEKTQEEETKQQEANERHEGKQDEREEVMEENGRRQGELKKAEEIKEDDKQKEIEEIEEKEKREVEDEKQKKAEELRGETKHGEVGELKVEEKKEKAEEEKEEERQEEAEESGEEGQREEREEVEEEKRQLKETQQVNDGEDDKREKEEVSPECFNERWHRALHGEAVRDRGENIFSGDGSSSADGGKIPKENPNVNPGEFLAKPSEETERIRMRQEEDEDGLDVDRPRSGESSLSYDVLLQTAENGEDGHGDPGDLSDDKVLHQGRNTERGDTETSSEGISSEAGGDVRGSEMNESAESPAVTRERAVPRVSEDPAGSSPPTTETGAFGLFRNAFGFFRQAPVARTTDPVGSGPSLDTNTVEASQTQSPQISEQVVDWNQVDEQDFHADSPVTTAPVEQPRHSSPSADLQSTTPSLHTETPLRTKTLSKHYNNLPAYMSVDEATVLTELFGRHKLQFLDYMLGSSGSAREEPEHDESILSDVERLLRYHGETLAAPGTRLADAPREDKEKTRTLIALQKLEMLITRVRETSSTGKSDTSEGDHQAEAGCAGVSTHGKDRELSTGEDSRKTGGPSVTLDNNDIHRMNEGLRHEKERETPDERREEGDEGCEEERVPAASRPHNQSGTPEPLEGLTKQILDFVHRIAEESATHVRAAGELVTWTAQVVSSLPDDIRPGPDLYGVPWEPIIVSSVLGLVTLLLFTCRCYSSVRSRMYRGKEQWMAAQAAELLDEKCKVLETLSKCQQEYDELEDSLRDSGALAQTQKTEHLEMKARQLEHAKKELERDLEQLKDQLEWQKQHREEQERRIAVLEEGMKTFDEETKELQSQEEQAQTTLKVYSMNSDRLQRNLETSGEENTLLQESNAQLRQQVEGWAERVSELEEEMRRCEVTYSGMQQDVANKDERIMSLTDCLLRMKAWDSDLEEEEGAEKETSNGAPGNEEENGRGERTDSQGHLQKVQKLIYAAKLNADLKSVDEDKDRVFAKLNNEVKAKEDLQVSIKELENEKVSLQSDAEHYSDQVQRLQQKLQIMTEMYQENELKLHRLLTVEEKERLQKEEKLNKADKNIALAMEELNNYRQRAEEMEEELEKSKQSYQTQISAHEKKAHNNWLAARAADRDLTDIRRENALLRQKPCDSVAQISLTLHSPNSASPPAERSPYGPSPLGRPASETRAFLSPPTLMDGPPTRLSPRVGRGPMEPPGGQGEMERSGGPHSDSGSISPTWERDRRGPPSGPPGPLGPPGGSLLLAHQDLPTQQTWQMARLEKTALDLVNRITERRLKLECVHVKMLYVAEKLFFPDGFDKPKSKRSRAIKEDCTALMHRGSFSEKRREVTMCGSGHCRTHLRWKNRGQAATQLTASDVEIAGQSLLVWQHIDDEFTLILMLITVLTAK
ncbi:hypothetical protein F2P81_003795 [Scophthalmus maximus]|uniref:Uncharacterized protein n=1 Tax=Scophthalmus maximus TaxID=52904 RepID=A0A6A4TDJ9_SCOMX|nr:hypothetical protein F2P81_003795 [Scophthalmus maximus]